MHNKALFTKPAKRFVVTVTCDISSLQFLNEKGKDELEMFLKGILESYNGTEFQLHAIPVAHTEQEYDEFS